jgi:hypothetical protein
MSDLSNDTKEDSSKSREGENTNMSRRPLKGQSHEKVGEIRVRGGILGPN